VIGGHCLDFTASGGGSARGCVAGQARASGEVTGLVQVTRRVTHQNAQNAMETNRVTRQQR